MLHLGPKDSPYSVCEAFSARALVVVFTLEGSLQGKVGTASREAHVHYVWVRVCAGRWR